MKRLSAGEQYVKRETWFLFWRGHDNDATVHSQIIGLTTYKVQSTAISGKWQHELLFQIKTNSRNHHTLISKGDRCDIVCKYSLYLALHVLLDFLDKGSQDKQIWYLWPEVEKEIYSTFNMLCIYIVTARQTCKLWTCSSEIWGNYLR